MPAHLNCRRAIFSKRTEISGVFKSQMYSVGPGGKAIPTSPVELKILPDLQAEIAHFGAKRKDYELRFVPTAFPTLV